MKTLFGKKGLLALIMALLFLLSSCSPEEILDMMEEGGILPEGEEIEHYVGFTKKEAERVEELEMVDAEDFEDYTSRFSSLRSSVYFNMLSEEEQRIYRLFEYALDEGYPCVYLDERLFEETEREPFEILYFLSLDSPLVEQNLSYSHSTLRIQMAEGLRQVTVTASLFVIDAFSPEKLEKKEEALKEAKKVVEGLEEGLSETEIARSFYLYLTENVKYYDYDDNADANYLYDALIGKETHCDGFTNAFSLLCNLAELEAFEKSDAGEEDEAGHTWNSVRLEGDWYNVDCALDEEVVQDQKDTGILVRFAFSDQRQTATAEFGEVLPSCEKDLLPLDCDFSSEKERGLSASVVEAFGKKGEDFLLIRLREGELGRSTLQSIANEMQCSFTVHAYSWGEDLYYVLIQK